MSKQHETICFILVIVMNLSAWIDLFGLFVQVPLIIPLTPEGWTLPSTLAMCINIANIAPVLLVILRWYQGKKFSEIPYIYIIIIVGIVSCCTLAIFWQKTVFIFGRERSLWLLLSVFTLSMLDCTSSLVFFDYMKRFRAHYLTAAFLGEGVTGIIPTLLALLQGVGSEAICIPSKNGTVLEPIYTEPRFSFTVFMLCISGVIVLSLTAFCLLQWTNIISLANAASLVTEKSDTPKNDTQGEESSPMVTVLKSQTSNCAITLTKKTFVILLIANTINSGILFGSLPSLSSYSMLPYGQKAFYYSTLLNPLAYPLASLISVYWFTVSTLVTILGSVCGLILFIFIVITALQSPCPLWADTVHGAVFMVFIWFLTTIIIAYVRITIGNRIRMGWHSTKTMFYFGTSVQLGMLLATIPTYSAVNILGIFAEREPCRTYCLSSN